MWRLAVTSEVIRRYVRWIATALMLLGVGLLATAATIVVEASRFQREQARALAAARASEPVSHSPAPALVPGAPLGVLEIPRLGLSVVVVSGDDDSTLSRAVGHLPDTPAPWEDGNSALAAHRDTYFRPLEHIRPGDTIHVTTLQGELRYVVRETMIVEPTDLWVLDPTETPALTLITCYPFQFIGHAPQRFIVRAERIERT
jgi:sortase A